MNKTIKLVIFLGVIAALSGLLIGAVNSITEPIITERLLASEKENLEVLFPGAEFVPLEGASDDGGYVQSAFEVSGEGYAARIETTGYNSSTPIQLLVGFDTEGTITGLMVIQEQETDGFGSKVFEQSFIDSAYVGKTLDDKVDLLSGATVTSSAVQAAITSTQAMIADLIG